MVSVASLLSLVHLVGLALAVGAATVKLTLLVACRADATSLDAYLRLDRTITPHIIVGMVLLTASGGGFLWLGYQVTRVMLVKLLLVGTIWVLGPVIDNVVEPRLRRLANDPRASSSPLFQRVRNQHLVLEVIATGLFYAIVVVWVLQLRF